MEKSPDKQQGPRGQTQHQWRVDLTPGWIYTRIAQSLFWMFSLLITNVICEGSKTKIEGERERERERQRALKCAINNGRTNQIQLRRHMLSTFLKSCSEKSEHAQVSATGIDILQRALLD